MTNPFKRGSAPGIYDLAVSSRATRSAAGAGAVRRTRFRRITKGRSLRRRIVSDTTATVRTESLAISNGSAHASRRSSTRCCWSPLPLECDGDLTAEQQHWTKEESIAGSGLHWARGQGAGEEAGCSDRVLGHGGIGPARTFPSTR